ncbi:retrovirus-related pol polyprotein from transposon TNT 1-94 [Tanacetum coccineum]|uniref:Retrovirus-related pol polyprotein from transposon TNT 1-94 n=1 Tax=Tanacetum coccineum TaxID=301880 RepID=A0ABQ5APV1_9ASTR
MYKIANTRVLMALADDELTIGKNHASNGEWIDITMRKIELIGKIQKIIFELNKFRDELLILRQEKLDAVTFQIQNTELTKLNHALQEQLKKEKKINEIWLTSSEKASQCITEQIAHQKKKVLGYDHEMVPKSKDWVERLNPYSKLTNFNTRRIIVPKSQAINESLKPTEGSNDPESSKVSPMSIGHEKYTLVIVDEYLRIDNGTEFRNHELKSFYDEKGISQNFSSPYTPEQNGVAERKNRTLIEAARTIERMPDINYFHVFGCPVFIHNHKDHLGKFDAKANDGYILRYYFVTKAFKVFNTRRQQVEETYHVTFDKSIKAIRFTNTSVDEIGIDDSSRYPPDEFIHEDDPFRKYQANSDISYYVIPHGPPDLINTEGTHEQNVKDEQIITQSTEGLSGNNTEALVSIIESLVPDVPQSQISNQASTSFHLVPQNRNKKDEHGITTKNKARLVTQGYSQEEGIDYDETFAPVARMESIRIFLAFTTYMNFIVFQMDVKSAFLNGKLKEEVYVKQPPDFKSSEFPNYVCKLDKALYGLKQAPKAWYETLSTLLIQNKFAKGRIDNTLFIYKSKEDVLLVQVYVDDIIFGSESYKLCKQFEKLMTKKFEMSMMGELTYFLGLFSMKTPMVPPYNLGPDLVGTPVNETLYRGMIGSLMYLTATRPDIQFSTVLCATYQSNPKESHLIVVKRILRYLKGTSTLGLYYPKCPGFDLKGYSDSDYAGLAISSAEAKYVAAAGCCASSDYTQDETFGSSHTILSNSNFSKGPSKVIKIELTTPMIVVNNQKDSVSPLPFSGKKKKVKSQIVTPTLPKSKGLKASGTLYKKRQNPKSKKTPSKT